MVAIRVRYQLKVQGISRVTSIDEWRALSVQDTNLSTITNAVAQVYPTASLSDIKIVTWIPDANTPQSIGGS